MFGTTIVTLFCERKMEHKMKKVLIVILMIGLMSCSLSAGDLPEEDSVNTEVQNNNDSN